jgi:predicted HTH transcriptional regulator
LINGLSLEKFYSGTSMPRNREVVRVFKDLNYIEQLGNGIPKIVKKYSRNAIEVDNFAIQTTLEFDADINGSTQKTTQKTTQETANKILNEIKNKPMIIKEELSTMLGITTNGVKWQLKKLKNKGIIRHVGTRKGGHWEIIEK